MYFPGFKASEQRMDPIYLKWLRKSPMKSHLLVIMRLTALGFGFRIVTDPVASGTQPLKSADTGA